MKLSRWSHDDSTSLSVYGLSRLLLRRLRAADCSLGQLETDLEVNRFDLLDSIKAAEKRGYQIEITFPGKTSCVHLHN